MALVLTQPNRVKNPMYSEWFLKRRLSIDVALEDSENPT
jgi:hypothetical protein